MDEEDIAEAFGDVPSSFDGITYSPLVYPSIFQNRFL
jgi:hypothetical protein